MLGQGETEQLYPKTASGELGTETILSGLGHGVLHFSVLLQLES